MVDFHLASDGKLISMWAEIFPELSEQENLEIVASPVEDTLITNYELNNEIILSIKSASIKFMQDNKVVKSFNHIDNGEECRVQVRPLATDGERVENDPPKIAYQVRFETQDISFLNNKDADYQIIVQDTENNIVVDQSGTLFI